MDCALVFQQYFPKTLFGNFSGDTKAGNIDVIQSILRNQTHDYIIRHQRPNPSRVEAFLKAHENLCVGGREVELARAVAKHFRLPPYALLRKTSLSPQVLKKIEEWDTYTGPKWQKVARLHAGIFENEVGHVLKSIGYKDVISEDDLRARGEGTATPDFVLQNFSKWWDAKNYYGCNNQFTRRILRKQAQKYVDKWSGSQGCFIFRYGFEEGLRKVVPSNVKIVSWDTLLSSNSKV